MVTLTLKCFECEAESDNPRVFVFEDKKNNTGLKVEVECPRCRNRFDYQNKVVGRNME